MASNAIDLPPRLDALMASATGPFEFEAVLGRLRFRQANVKGRGDFAAVATSAGFRQSIDVFQLAIYRSSIFLMLHSSTDHAIDMQTSFHKQPTNQQKVSRKRGRTAIFRQI
jgi:hypothetical protein